MYGLELSFFLWALVCEFSSYRRTLIFTHVFWKSNNMDAAADTKRRRTRSDWLYPDLSLSLAPALLFCSYVLFIL